MLTRRLSAQARSVDLDDIEAWFAQVYPGMETLVSTGYRSTSMLAGRYLAAHAAAEGVLVTPLATATLDTARVATSLRVAGPVAFKTHVARTGSAEAAQRVMVQSLTGSARRLILAGARDTTRATVDGSATILGYRRVTSASPCSFCAMLASRGAVYKSERTAGAGDRYHDSCSCTQEPVYRRDRGESAPFAAEWQRAKAEAAGAGVRTDVAFRRLIEQRG